ncbi:gluconokinase [Nannocystis pusilla]|uniref:gluconokinase n=1 Tax=Nannocystis pusilla TaxID=889268 RepID=UPI003DA2E9F6
MRFAHRVVIVVMGVSGAGKTTIGQRLAAALGARFVDADEFHTPANRAKMAAGTPLDDADRAPWLHTLATEIDGWLQHEGDVVLACSALRAVHRAMLRRDATRVVFVYLQIDPDVARARLLARRHHFLKPTCWPASWRRWSRPPTPSPSTPPSRSRRWWPTSSPGSPVRHDMTFKACHDGHALMNMSERAGDHATARPRLLRTVK